MPHPPPQPQPPTPHAEQPLCLATQANTKKKESQRHASRIVRCKLCDCLTFCTDTRRLANIPCPLRSLSQVPSSAIVLLLRARLLTILLGQRERESTHPSRSNIASHQIESSRYETDAPRCRRNKPYRQSAPKTSLSCTHVSRILKRNRVS